MGARRARVSTTFVARGRKIGYRYPSGARHGTRRCTPASAYVTSAKPLAAPSSSHWLTVHVVPNTNLLSARGLRLGLSREFSIDRLPSNKLSRRTCPPCREVWRNRLLRLTARVLDSYVLGIWAIVLSLVTLVSRELENDREDRGDRLWSGGGGSVGLCYLHSVIEVNGMRFLDHGANTFAQWLFPSAAKWLRCVRVSAEAWKRMLRGSRVRM